MSLTDRPFTKVHFIGIGGSGMSGIAQVLHERGYSVTGSDLKTSRYLRSLERSGVDIRIGHDAAHIDEIQPDVVVISTAIPERNVESKRAKELGLPIMHRSQMLSVLGEGRITIAIAGTHGKTTTSSMTSIMLERADHDPTFLVGGTVMAFDTNGKNGSGDFFVAEADESDGSFVNLKPSIIVITNIEAEHMDHYDSIDQIESIFEEFIGLLPEDGVVIVCGEAERARALVERTGVRMLTYGFGDDVDVRCELREKDEPSLITEYDVTFPDGTRIAAHNDHNPGKHNVLNATAALSIAYELELELEGCAEALSSFDGVRRRFDPVGTAHGVTIVDDYAHHPTEIEATLEAAASLGYSNVHVIFQSHRFSRTKAFLEEFGSAFHDADSITLMDIFSAGEAPIPGITSKSLIRSISKYRPKAPLAWFPKRLNLVDFIVDRVHDGDLLITMGAGDVTTIGPTILERLKEKQEAGR